MIDRLKTFVLDMEAFLAREARRLDLEQLKGPQGRVVSLLAKSADQEIAISSIVEELQISKSVASNLIRRMERNGFIRIRPSSKDRRYKYLELTELGRSKAESIAVFKEAVRCQALKGIDQEALQMSCQVFEQISANIKEE